MSILSASQRLKDALAVAGGGRGGRWTNLSIPICSVYSREGRHFYFGGRRKEQLKSATLARVRGNANKKGEMKKLCCVGYLLKFLHGTTLGGDII